MNEVSTILTSRRFWTFVFWAIAAMITIVFPAFNGYEAVFVEVSAYVAIALVMGYSLQDIAKEVWARPDFQVLVKDKQFQETLESVVITILKALNVK